MLKSVFHPQCLKRTSNLQVLSSTPVQLPNVGVDVGTVVGAAVGDKVGESV